MKATDRILFRVWFILSWVLLLQNTSHHILKNIMAEWKASSLISINLLKYNHHLHKLGVYTYSLPLVQISFTWLLVLSQYKSIV